MITLNVIMDESIPNQWVNRRSFLNSRRLLIIQWVVMAGILSWGYQGTLLSTLVAIRYDEPLDTIDQMVESGLPFGILENSAIEWLAKTDPRGKMQLLNDRRHLVKWNGTVTEDVFKK